MRRRDFVAGLAGAASGALSARAQQRATAVIGFLSGASLEEMRGPLAAFYEGLAREGYVENRNIAAEYRWAEGENGRLPGLVADLIRSRVDLIAVLASTPGALAAKAATQTIPIVCEVGTDPVKVGLVASLARPGGNLTGVTVVSGELMAKNISLMHELVPAADPIAVLFNPANAAQTEVEMRDAQVAGRTLGLRLLTLNASTPGEIDQAFRTLTNERAGALVLAGENFFVAENAHIVALAARYAVPTMYFDHDAVKSGGLVGYGIPNAIEAFRVVGGYAGRILKGAKPADLPVQQATRIDLALNLRTAKALGLQVPTGILLRATEVIE